MRTAMQEVLEKCQDESVTFEELGKWVSISVYMLLEKEKQQIIDANIAGMEFIPVDPNKYQSDAQQYYNETYKQ